MEQLCILWRAGTHTHTAADVLLSGYFVRVSSDSCSIYSYIDFNEVDWLKHQRCDSPPLIFQDKHTHTHTHTRTNTKMRFDSHLLWNQWLNYRSSAVEIRAVNGDSVEDVLWLVMIILVLHCFVLHQTPEKLRKGHVNWEDISGGYLKTDFRVCIIYLNGLKCLRTFWNFAITKSWLNWCKCVECCTIFFRFI